MCSIWLLISGILYATTRISSRSTGPPDPYMFKSPNPKYMVGEIPSEFGIWHIDRTKYVKVRVFESHIYVDIRQYYESLDGKLMPSKCVLQERRKQVTMEEIWNYRDVLVTSGHNRTEVKVPHSARQSLRFIYLALYMENNNNTRLQIFIRRNVTIILFIVAVMLVLYTHQVWMLYFRGSISVSKDSTGISLTQYEWEKLVKIVPSISGTIFNYTYFENLD